MVTAPGGCPSSGGCICRALARSRSTCTARWGRVKTIQIEGRRWMLVLSCDEVPTNALPATGQEVGVDVGIVRFGDILATAPCSESPLGPYVCGSVGRGAAAAGPGQSAIEEP